MTHIFTARVFVSFAAAVALFVLPKVVNTEGDARTVRLLVAHEPRESFARAAAVFAEELSARTGGRLRLEVATPPEEFERTDVPDSIARGLIEKGAVDIALVYATPYAREAPSLLSLQAPFMFSPGEGMERVLGGAEAARALQELSERTDARALAFATGGFRIIAGKTSRPAVTDFTNARVATCGGVASEALMSALGATALPRALEGTPDYAAIDAIETTYARLAALEARGVPEEFSRVITETNHSIYLTVLLTSDAFVESLSPQERRALEDAAKSAARVQWEDAVALEEKAKAALQARGSTVVSLSDEERDALTEKAAGIGEAFDAAVQ